MTRAHQALLDDAAVLTCMSYVDLNPIRAKMAETPEESDFTSIQLRIRNAQVQTVAVPEEVKPAGPAEAPREQPPLMPLVKANQDEHVHALGYSERDYLELVDWAGRAVRADKRGAIPIHTPPILNRLGLDPGRFLHHMGGKSKLTHHLTAIGSLVGSRSRRCSRSPAPGAIYRLHPCNRTFGIHAFDRLQALAKKMGQSFLKGNGLARQLYCAAA